MVITSVGEITTPGEIRSCLPCLLSACRWEKKIPMTKSNLEKTWLFHEIGRCYLELGKAEAAQNYGQKSLQAADEEGDAEWQLHAIVLVAQAQGRGVSTNLNCPDQDILESCSINHCCSPDLGLK